MNTLEEIVDTLATIVCYGLGTVVSLIVIIVISGGLACLWNWAKNYRKNIDTSCEAGPKGTNWAGYEPDGYESAFGKRIRRKEVNRKRKQARKSKKRR